MMIIDKNNSLDINDKVTMHDDVILNFDFDRENKILTLNLVDGYSDDTFLKNIDENHYDKSSWVFYAKHYVVKFINVIGFEMTSCDFWGKSDRINEISLVEDKKLINKLIEKTKEKKGICYNLDGSKGEIIKHLSKDDFIEINIEFISGDNLIVACEIINFSK